MSPDPERFWSMKCAIRRDTEEVIRGREARDYHEGISGTQREKYRWVEREEVL